jgi:hypothetical protein
MGLNWPENVMGYAVRSSGIYQKKLAGMDHGLITVRYLFCYVSMAVSDTSTPSPFGTPASKIIFQKISLSLVFSLVVINLLFKQN